MIVPHCCLLLLSTTVPKFDELCAVVEANNPDIICIVETWLDTSILDSEIALPGYQLHRFDRNRHGGGVLAYVRCHFEVSLHPSPDNLELLTLSVCKGVNKICISVFYHRPNSLSEGFDNLFMHLQSFDTSQFSNYILLGDFDVNFCNGNHPFYSRLYNMFSYFGLTQVVSEPTRIRPDETSSMIDLIAMSSPNLLLSCTTVPPLSNSDHLGLLLHSQWRHYNPPVDHSPRALWMHKHADWTRARGLIEVTDWN